MLMLANDRKLNEQEAREKVSTDQLASTDIRTREFENMVHLYKYVVFLNHVFSDTVSHWTGLNILCCSTEQSDMVMR